MVKKLFLVFLTFVFTVNVFGQSEIQKELEASKEKYNTYKINQAIEIRNREESKRNYYAGFIGNKMLKKMYLDADNTYRKIKDLNELDALLELIETEEKMMSNVSYGRVALTQLWSNVSRYRDIVEKFIKKEEPKEEPKVEVVETKTKSKSKKVSDDMYF